MGYRYIAIGGLVRNQTPEILRILRAVQPELQPGTQVHLFGVNVLSKSNLREPEGDKLRQPLRLRRVWKDVRHNYFLGDDAFTAIRVPEAGSHKKHQLDEACICRQEQALLEMLAPVIGGRASLEETLGQALVYAALSGPPGERLRNDYRWKLEAQPWRQCPCHICREIGKARTPGIMRIDYIL